MTMIRWQRSRAADLAVWSITIGLCSLTHSGVAIATQPDEMAIQKVLMTAEKAYQEVDFATVYDSSCVGLEVGHADVPTTTRLNILCGISSAALAKPEEAKRHFILALAVRPDLQLERELSPKIRGPYLEAQGYWGAQSERVTLRIINRDSARQILVRAQDPANLASRVELYLRPFGQSKFELTMLKSATPVSVPLSEVYFRRGYEYYARLTDAQSNALVSVGNEAEPIEVRPIRDLQPQDTATDARRKRLQENSSNQRRSLWLPVTLTLSGVALSAVGVYFNVRRENAAHQWNGPACEQPGLSRIEQCGDIDTERTHFERAAIGFYLTGGLFLAGGLASFAFGNRSDARMQSAANARKSFDCAPGLIAAHIVCHGEF